MAVCVVDPHPKPLLPGAERRARLLLEHGRARIPRIVPFPIRLGDRRVEDSARQPIRLKLDPGRRTPGMALGREQERVEPPRTR